MTDDKTRRMVPVGPLLDQLTRRELQLKLAGAFEQAGGIRFAVMCLLRLADAGEVPIDPSEST